MEKQTRKAKRKLPSLESMTEEQIRDSVRTRLLKEFSKSDKSAKICYSLVKRFFKKEPEKVNIWFFTANPLLGNVKPFEMIMLSRSEKLLSFIKDCKFEGGW